MKPLALLGIIKIDSSHLKTGKIKQKFFKGEKCEPKLTLLLTNSMGNISKLYVMKMIFFYLNGYYF